MKHFITILILMGAMGMRAEEPAPLPAAPEVTVTTDPTEQLAPAEAPGQPERPTMRAAPGQPESPRPATEAEVVVQETIDAAITEPPAGEGATEPTVTAPGAASTAPAIVGTASTTPSTTAVATSLPATTQASSTQPSTAMAATTRSTTGMASTQPGLNRDRFTRVTAQPRSIAAAKTMPKDFSLLVSRSVFVHGRMPTDAPPRDPRNEGSSVATTPAPRPEKTLLFNGSTNSDGEVVAFIEDTLAAKVFKLRVGDPVARGKVAGLTLETLDYDSAGKVRRVMLGQNLDGEATTATTRPTMATSTTGPTSGPASGSTGGGPLADILERLRQKRAKELGGK